VVFKVVRMKARLTPGSPEWQALEALGAQARASDEIINGVTPGSPREAVELADTHLAALRETILKIQADHPGLVDPDVPVIPEGAVQPSDVSPAQPTGRRVDLAAHAPETAVRIGEQISIDLSSPNWQRSLPKLGRGVECVYAVRDNATGEVLKIGSTADLPTRASVYARVGRLYTGRSLSIEVQAVEAGGANPKVESVETPLRASVVRGVDFERAGQAPLDRTPVLPWDATSGRLAGEPRGPATPGIRNREMRRAGERWWRERKWGAASGAAEPARARGRPQGLPPDADLVDLLIDCDGNVSEVARRTGVNYDVLRRYLRRSGLTAESVVATEEQ
jgi:hypothetical protein